MIKIEMPDGTALSEMGKAALTAGNVSAAANMGQDVPRTIAVVANELEAAIAASRRVKPLTDELQGLLGKKRRGPISAT